jgi:hypothetical protein
MTGCSNALSPGRVAKLSTSKKSVKVKKTPPPNVISVSDYLASKNPEGRLFYDFQGQRYWRNNKDGRYYLYQKSFYNDPAFKPN